MTDVIVTASRTVRGTPERVRAALADYAGIRPAILTENYSEYEVREGGQGPGTKVHWKLAATSKRVRDQLVEVSEDTSADIPALIESDQNSSMVTRWVVYPRDDENESNVVVITKWKGATGVGGFFERTFAPGGLRRIHETVIGNLDAHLNDSNLG
ncbi:SRPBCC family protein [Pseudonocardia eucalypti]|uniref:SRPBCC family protein n=1 Tax=Pseudonocardia eucalypti TaxID=648755 RepID=A0ABP9PGG8_9PSEU|nr:hypothetical protein [Pseudonocardia eucalypti]